MVSAITQRTNSISSNTSGFRWAHKIPSERHASGLATEVQAKSEKSPHTVRSFCALDSFHSSFIACTVPVAFSEARFQVKKSACFWRHGRYQE